jgi:hypothetical protein
MVEPESPVTETAEPMALLVEPAEPVAPVTETTSQPVPALAQDHPMEYRVKRGDTLWGIAGRFLSQPWLWPEVWYINPKIRNPHLIYPGNVIELVYVDGRPQLRLKGDSIKQAEHAEQVDPATGQISEVPAQAGSPVGVVRLSPQIRKIPVEEAISSIPYKDLRPFLVGSVVVDSKAFDRAGYIMRPFEEEQMIIGANDRVYVRGVDDAVGNSYQIIRKVKPLIDPDSRELLGYEAVNLGLAQIITQGDPATAITTESSQEILIGDRLIAAPKEPTNYHFFPKAPSTQVKGKIISMHNAISQVGQFQVVTLNKGSRDGLTTGDVLAIFEQGKKQRDVIGREKVQIPDRRKGELMVFRVFDQVSYALIMSSTRSIRPNDLVSNP